MTTSLIPVAVSSQLDVSGEEKIHAAKYQPVVKTVYVPAAVWAISGHNAIGNGRVAATSFFPATVWTNTGTTPDECGFMLYYQGVLYVSSEGSSARSKSLDRGATWIPILSSNTSAGGGKLAAGGGYIYLCNGVNAMDRYDAVNGWVNTGTNTSRANDAVYLGTKLVVASIYDLRASFSNNQGSTWAYGSGNYGTGSYGSPCLATDGSRIVILFNDGSPVYTSRIAYSDDGGQTWTAAYAFSTTGSTNNASALHYHNGFWIASTLLGQVVYSINGINWTLSATTLVSVKQMASGNGKILAILSSGAALATIDGGVTWQSVTGIPTTVNSPYTGTAWIGA